MNTQNWTKGHVLSEDEYEEFIESVRLERVFVVPPQPAPGVAFTAPGGEVGIYCSQDMNFLEVLDFGDDEPNQVRFLGNQLTQEEAAELAIDFIQSESFEASVAVFFNFDATKFNPEVELIAELANFFWVRSTWLNPEALKIINSKLFATNSAYQTISQFLEDPNSPKFAKLKQNVTSLMDFSSAYNFET